MHFTREDVIAIARYARIVVGLRREEEMTGRGLLHAANGLEHQLALYPYAGDESDEAWRNIVNDAFALHQDAAEYARRALAHACPACGRRLPSRLS